MADKKTRGRQKTEMKCIEKESNRLVTFSKRRSGIYKKVGELSILCGAEVAMMGITDQCSKPYSFCTPSEKVVLDKFLNRASEQSDPTLNLLGTVQIPRIQELIDQHNALLARSEEQKVHVEALKRMEGARKSSGWWEADMEKLSLQEIQVMDSLLEDLLKETHHNIDKLSGGPASVLFTSLIKKFSK